MRARVYLKDQRSAEGELTQAEMERLSRLDEVAAVVCLEESFGGSLTIYEDGKSRQWRA